LNRVVINGIEGLRQTDSGPCDVPFINTGYTLRMKRAPSNLKPIFALENGSSAHYAID